MTPFAKVYFKDWLPDLPEHENPGLLEANNARPVNGTYSNMPTMATSSLCANISIPTMMPRARD